MTFIPSPQQSAYFDWLQHGSGNAIVEAVAGAGKTTTLIKGLQFMSGRSFLGAFNSKMADELKERIAGMSGVSASTFHAAGNRQLQFSFGRKHALGIEKYKVADIVADICLQRPDLEPISHAIPKIVSMAKQRGFGAITPMAEITNDDWQEMIETFALDEDLPEDARIEQVIAFAKAALNRSNNLLALIDFDDMVYLPLFYKLRMLQYDWVLIDEAQDTNPTRRALAAKMLAPGGRLIAVGDPRQAIFGFTGADNDSLQQLKDQFDCTSLPLTVTYRCPKAVVNLARNWVSHIEAHETAPEGAVEEIKYSELLDTVKPGDAILCRNTKYLVSTFFKLVREGRSAKVEGRNVGEGLISLAGKWKVKTYDALRSRLEDFQKREVEKAMKKRQESRADRINDQVETLLVLIDRAVAQNLSTVPELQEMIKGIFSDDVAKRGDMITLCTVHRSKGLEWDRVFLLGRKELMPSPFAIQAWQMEQEANLIYVAVTRAKQTLVEVTDVVSKKNKHRGLMFMGA